MTTSAAAVVLLVGVTGAWALLREDENLAPQRVAAPEVTSTTTVTTSAVPTTAPAPPSATVATTSVSQLVVFQAPSEAAGQVTTLSDTTEYGLPRTLLVIDEKTPEWLGVLLPLKPNGQTGWIRASEVALGSVSYKIEIDRATHALKLFNGAQLVLETPVAVGTPGTPTPGGTFYITDPVDLRSNPGGSYGAFALGLSGYSNVLEQFAGGPPQVAVHGTNRPDLIGQDVSNGCVRVPNDMIVQIADQVPLGTPVVIT